MKMFGIIILLIGGLGLAAALGMDTSVDTGFGRVNNLGLMKDQQNYLLVSALLIVVGTIMVLASRSRPSAEILGASSSADMTKICPDCAEVIKRDARVCRYCGNREFDEETPGAGRATAAIETSSAKIVRTKSWKEFGTVLAVLSLTAAAGIGAVWLWGDDMDASGNGTYTAKDVLVGAWTQLSGDSTQPDGAATENETAANQGFVAADNTASHPTDFRRLPSAKHRKLSPPDANGCIKELAEDAGLHCAPVSSR